MYAKKSRWLPVLYAPLQTMDHFISIYCKSSKWIPCVWDELKEHFKKKIIEKDYQNVEIDKKQSLMIEAEAMKMALDYWDTFWTAVENVQEKGVLPFVIKVRKLDLK